METSVRIQKISIVANWFVIALLIGFFSINTVPKIFGLSDESFSIEFRALILVFSLYFIFNEILSNKIKSHSVRVYSLFLLFWLIYGFRIIYDLFIDPIKLYEDKNAAYYFQFAFGACLVPSLALISVIRRYQLNFDYILKWTYGLLFIVLLISIYYRISSGIEGRTIGDINVGIQSVGVFGTILCLFSVYNLVAQKPNLSYKAISIFGIVVGFSGIIVSASKAPFIALIIVVALLILFWYGRIKFFLILTFFIIIGSIYSISILDYFNNYFNSGFLDRLLYFIEIGGDTAREELLSAALTEFLQNPFLGNAFLIQKAGYTGGFPHSFLVEAFMSTGFIGGSLFLVYLFKCIIFSIKLIKKKSPYTSLSLLFLQSFIFGMISDNLYTNDSFWFISIIIIGVYHFEFEDSNRLKKDRLNKN